MCGSGRFGETSPVNGSALQHDAEHEQQDQSPEKFRNRQQQDRTEIGDRLEQRAAQAEQQKAAAEAEYGRDHHGGERRVRSSPAGSRRPAIPPRGGTRWSGRNRRAARRQAKSGIAAAAAYRDPSRGAWLRSPRSSRSAAATSRPDRPVEAAVRRTAAPKRSAGSGSPPAGGARSASGRGCEHLCRHSGCGRLPASPESIFTVGGYGFRTASLRLASGMTNHDDDMSSSPTPQH